MSRVKGLTLIRESLAGLILIPASVILIHGFDSESTLAQLYFPIRPTKPNLESKKAGPIFCQEKRPTFTVFGWKIYNPNPNNSLGKLLA